MKIKSLIVREEVHRALKTEAASLGIPLQRLAEWKLGQELGKHDLRVLQGL